MLGCSDDTGDGGDADEAPDATLSTPETAAPQPLEATVPIVSSVDGADSFVAEALADEVVTDDELDAAYIGYVGCLGDGGGSGRYAYDVALRTGLAIDWAEEASGDVDRDVLAAGCSERFLGDLARRHRAAAPPAEDLAERQRASVAACVEAVSPRAAANLPEQITIGTAGDAASVGELQLDPATLDPESLGADEADVDAVADCIASIGAEWRPFP